MEAVRKRDRKVERENLEWGKNERDREGECKNPMRERGGNPGGVMVRETTQREG